VTVDGEVTGRIGTGLLALVGVGREDTEKDARWLAEKTAGLRIFQDVDGKMNLSVRDAGGEVLAVSQFTLLADARKGRRPSFDAAAPPDAAEKLYAAYVEYLKEEGCPVSCGVFQAHMMVRLVNDGPVTILLESPAAGNAQEQ